MVRKNGLRLGMGVLALVLLCAACAASDRGVPQGGAQSVPGTVPERAAYGVMIGVDPEDAALLYGYDTVVIDAAFYSRQDIADCKARGITVYSYLNIGALETFREFFSQYEDGILGAYDDWPGEYWMDVSLPAWQDHLLQEATALVEKGVDGLFLDNADVYYEYATPEIFEGLVGILQRLEQLQTDLILNGGDTFVAEAVLERDSPLVRVTGVNQECVFTRIDFERGRLDAQTPEDTAYFQRYLRQCKDAGLAVYLTEYLEEPGGALAGEIADYCDANGFTAFLSSSVELDGQ